MAAFRAQRTVAAALTVLVAVPACLGLVSCARPKALSLDPPVLHASSWSGASSVSPVAWSWPGAAGRRGEVRPPRLTAQRWLILQPGDTLELSLGGITAPPQGIMAEFFPIWEFDTPDGPGTATASSTVDPSAVRSTTDPEAGGALSWSWVLPAEPVTPQPLDTLTAYVLRLRVEWREETWCVYYLPLQALQVDPAGVNRRHAEQALRTTRALFESMWAHSEQQVSRLMSQSLLNYRNSATGKPESYLSVDSVSPWDAVLWRGVGQTFELVSGPRFTLHSYVPPAKGGWAQVGAAFTVELTEGVGAEPIRHDFTEHYHLDFSEGEWRLSTFWRQGIPYLADGGTCRGWSAETTVSGNAMKVGPFSYVNLWSEAYWDPSGRRFAVQVQNFDRTEVWVLEPARGQSRRVVPVEGAAAGFPPAAPVSLAGWSAGGETLVFISENVRTDEEGQAERGYTVSQVPVGGGGMTDIAFVPTTAPYLKQAVLTADGTALMLHVGSDLFRVDLGDGRITTLQSGLPSYDGLFSILFSPDGWAAAWRLFEEVPSVVVVDLHGGNSVTLPTSEDGWNDFMGWTPGGCLIVADARREDVNPGEDFDYAGGYTGLRVYDRSGRLLGKLEPPGGPDTRIGAMAWSPDGSVLLFSCGPMEAMSEPNLGGPGALVRIARLDTLWAWETGTGTVTAIDQIGAEYGHLSWPVPSVARLTLGYSGELGTVDYIITRDGGLSASRRAWHGPRPDRILAEAGEALLLVMAEPRDATGRTVFELATETAGGRAELYEGPLNLASGPVGDGLVAFVDESAAFNLQVFVVVIAWTEPAP
ncbi:MAG: hypothetical protein C4551_05740 [Bacillota bacterium]|nr:MAG: hypothetical protein C4551_05740 [Bacillota bacterium]